MMPINCRVQMGAFLLGLKCIDQKSFINQVAKKKKNRSKDLGGHLIWSSSQDLNSLYNSPTLRGLVHQTSNSLGALINLTTS